MKYRVKVPQAETRRMQGQPIRVVVHVWDGWEVSDKQEFVLEPDSPGVLDFNVPDEARHETVQSANDALTFRVYAVYRNSTGSRTETKELEPEKV